MLIGMIMMCGMIVYVVCIHAYWYDYDMLMQSIYMLIGMIMICSMMAYTEYIHAYWYDYDM